MGKYISEEVLVEWINKQDSYLHHFVRCLVHSIPKLIAETSAKLTINRPKNIKDIIKWARVEIGLDSVELPSGNFLRKSLEAQAFPSLKLKEKFIFELHKRLIEIIPEIPKDENSIVKNVKITIVDDGLFIAGKGELSVIENDFVFDGVNKLYPIKYDDPIFDPRQDLEFRRERRKEIDEAVKNGKQIVVNYGSVVKKQVKTSNPLSSEETSEILLEHMGV